MTEKDTYHHGNLRQELLDEAVILIGKKGVSGLSMREVAARLGVSHTAPYHHFRDKSALLWALADNGAEQLSQRMKKKRDEAGQDPLKQLLGVGMAYIEFAVACPEYYEVSTSLLLLDQKDDGENEAACLENNTNGTWEHLFGLVSTCQATGALPQGDPVLMSISLWSLVHGMAELWRSGSLYSFPESEAGLESLAHNVLNAAVGITASGTLKNNSTPH